VTTRHAFAAPAGWAPSGHASPVAARQERVLATPRHYPSSQPPSTLAAEPLATSPEPFDHPGRSRASAHEREAKQESP